MKAVPVGMISGSITISPIEPNGVMTVSMSIPPDNTMPWGFIEGTIENHADGYPVIVQIYQNDEPIHFAQTSVNEDGTYEYKFRARNLDGNNAVNVYEGDYEVKIFKSIQITGKNLI